MSFPSERGLWQTSLSSWMWRYHPAEKKEWDRWMERLNTPTSLYQYKTHFSIVIVCGLVLVYWTVSSTVMERHGKSERHKVREKRKTERRVNLCNTTKPKLRYVDFFTFFLSSGFQSLQQESITPSCNLSISVCNDRLLIWSLSRSYFGA